MESICDFDVLKKRFNELADQIEEFQKEQWSLWLHLREIYKPWRKQ